MFLKEIENFCTQLFLLNSALLVLWCLISLLSFCTGQLQYEIFSIICNRTESTHLHRFRKGTNYLNRRWLVRVKNTPSLRARSMKGASFRFSSMESMTSLFPIGTSTKGSIPLTCNKRILFPFRISAVCGGSSWFEKSIRAVGTMVRKMMKAKNCWCYIFCWVGFWKNVAYV